MTTATTRLHRTLLATAIAVAVTPVAAQQLEEITVTARKIEESLQDIPVAVTAFSAQELERRGITNLGDIAAYTPGLSFEDYSAALEAPVIRGQNQVRLNNPVQNVSTFLDGVYLQRSYMIDVGVVALDRVEVVKGPQSALYGQNSFAGAINYVPKKPTEEFEADIDAGVGSDEYQSLRATLAGPIVPGVLLGRITAGTQEYDGTWENAHPLADSGISPGSDGNLGGYDNQTFAGNLLLRPTDALSFELGYYRSEIDQEARPSFTRMGRDGIALFGFAPSNRLNCSSTVNPGLPFLGASNALHCGELTTFLPPEAGRGESIILDPRSFGQKGENEVLTFRANWEINDALSLNYLYGEADSELRSGGQSIPDGLNGWFAPPPFLAFAQGLVVFDSQPNGGLESESHELRLDYSSGGLLDVSAGIYLYESDDIYEAIGYFLPPLGTAPLPSLPNSDPNPDFFHNEIEALFARVGLNLMDERLKISLEARYSEDEKEVETIGIDNTFASDTFYEFTPRVTVDYQLTDDTLLYASLAEGTKSGGFNSPILGGSGRPIDRSQASYDAESNTTLELGAKNRLLDGRVIANAAIYYIDWTDLQINTSPIGGAPNDPVVIDNIGGASTWGVEFEGVWLVNDSLTLNGGISYNDPTFDDGTIYIEAASDGWCDGIVCPTDGDIGGNTLNRVPKTQAVAGAQWEGALGNGLGYYVRGDVTYQSKQYMELLNVGYVPERTLVNGRFGITGEHWEVALWAKNLFDETYVSNSLFLGFSNAYVAFLGEQRTYGLTARYSF